MKLSQFTVVVNDYPKPDQRLLYNTLSRALIQVDKQAWDVLQNLSKGVPIEPQGRAPLEPLRNQGFLVPKEIKEGERFLAYLNQSPNQKGGEVSVTLLTNLQRCPLACGYCYQYRERTSGSAWRAIFRTNVSRLSKDSAKRWRQNVSSSATTAASHSPT